MYLRLADAEDGGGSSTEVGGASEFRRGARRRTTALALSGASDDNGAAELWKTCSLTWVSEEASSMEETTVRMWSKND